MAHGYFVRVSRYVGLGLILFLCGCATTKSAPSRFYVLNSQYVPDISGQSFEGGNRMIAGIGPVEIPSYLDRQEIVTRQSNNEIVLHDFDKWAEPLAEGITRVLMEDLSHLLRDKSFTVIPWTGSKMITHQIVLEVVRFDGVLGEDVTLTARWAILDKKENRTVLSNGASFVEPTGTPDHDALVAAQSRALGRLGQKIADGIQEVLDH